MHARPALLLTLALPLAAAAEPPRYAVTRLGEVPSTSASIHGISPSGAVTGAITHQGYVRAFGYAGGVLTEYHHPSGLTTLGRGVNDFGVIVGEANEAGYPRPFVADPVLGVRELVPLGVPYGVAYGINNAGTIVGSASIGGYDGPYIPFSYRDGAGTALPLPPGATSGVAAVITSEGLIAGAVEDAQTRRAAQWSNGAVSLLDVPAGFTSGYAMHATDTGFILGSARDTSGLVTYILWRDGVPTLIPGLTNPDCFITGLSDAGHVVGTMITPPLVRAMVWVDGLPHQLDTLLIGAPGFRMVFAHGIDASGRIIATGNDDLGVIGTFLLTPIPAPASLLLFPPALIAATRRRRPRA